ncbi:hypothetical protein [Kitasatospora sp. NPDC085464]|uniref:hypothetical protein n=1 Tax=Kitasatospora sp. NPDC085464 TaxID=3364063 RepID=UPI0037C80446
MEQTDLAQRGAKVARLAAEFGAAAAKADIGLFTSTVEAAVRDELHPEVLAAMLAAVLKSAPPEYRNVHGIADIRRLGQVTGPSEFAIAMIDRGGTIDEAWELYPNVREAADLLQDAATRLHASGTGESAIRILHEGLEADEDLVVPALQLASECLALATGAAKRPRKLAHDELQAVLCDRLTDAAFRHQPFEIAQTINEVMKADLGVGVVFGLLDALHHRMPTKTPRRPDGALDVIDLTHTDDADTYTARLTELGYTPDVAQRMYPGAAKAAFHLQRCAVHLAAGRPQVVKDRLAAAFEQSQNLIVPACHLVAHMGARMAELLSEGGELLRPSRAAGLVFRPGGPEAIRSETRMGPLPSWPGPPVDSGEVVEDEFGTLPVVADVAGSAPWWNAPAADHVPRWRDRMTEMLSLPTVAQETARMIENGRGTIGPAINDTQRAVRVLAVQEEERLSKGRVWFVGPRVTARARAAATTALDKPLSFDRLPSRSGLVVFSGPLGAYYSKEWDHCTHHPVIPVVAVSWGPFKGGWAKDTVPTPERDEQWWYKRNAGVSDEEAAEVFGEAGRLELVDGRTIPVGLFRPERDEDGKFQEWLWFTFWVPTGALLKSLPEGAQVSPDRKLWAPAAELRAFREHDSPLEWEDELLLRMGQQLATAPEAGSRLAWARGAIEALAILKMLLDKVADLDGQPIVGREIEVPRRERPVKQGKGKTKRVRTVDRVTVVDLEEPKPLVPSQRAAEDEKSGRTWTPQYGREVEERTRQNHCRTPRQHRALVEELGECPNHGPVTVRAHRWGKNLPLRPVNTVGRTS